MNWVICVFLVVSGLEAVHNSDEVVRALHTIMEAGENCHGCGKSGVEVPVSEMEMHDVRLEFIKAEILKKLQLKEVPNVMKTPKMPLPMKIVTQKTTPAPPTEVVKEDSFFAQTNRIVLLATPASNDMCEYDKKPSSCFGFEFSKEILAEDVSSVEFWVYKNHDFFDNDPQYNQTFVYYEVNGMDLNEMQRTATKVEEGWIQLNYTKRLKYWLENEIRQPQLKVQCSSCGYMSPWTPISMKTGQEPILVINMENNIQKKRLKRNVNCHAGVTECCREKLYVSFKDIGWDGWIIAPEGYDAYFCKGSCNGASSIPLSDSLHASIRNKFFTKGMDKKMELVSCCAATQHSAKTIIYKENNKTITSKNVPGMVVETCGCM